VIGGDGERSVSLENPLWSGATRVAIFTPAGVASGDIAQNHLLEPLSQAAATQLYRKDKFERHLEEAGGAAYNIGNRNEAQVKVASRAANAICVPQFPRFPVRDSRDDFAIRTNSRAWVSA
jgi:hypothetical protein